MLWPSIIAVILFFIVAALLGFLFLMPLIVVVANTAILYLLFLRIYTEITKYKRAETYAYSFVASFLLLVIIGNYLPLWKITTATFTAFVIAHLYTMYKR